MKCDCIEPCVTCVLARLVDRMGKEIQELRLKNSELEQRAEALRRLVEGRIAKTK